MSKHLCGVFRPNKVYQKLTVENLTVMRPPILKIYYWESFGITGLNKKLQSNKPNIEHDLVVPVRQYQSPPLKMIFWLRNLSSEPLQLQLKRVQHCQCQPLETRVGFNQFRQLYHCPHRRLIHIKQEVMRLQPDEVLPLSVTVYFFLLGEHWLTYEMQTNDDRVFTWNFKLEISAFDPKKCLLSKELLPVNIKNFEQITQPIWVQNISMSHLRFNFTSREKNLRMHNMNLTVPRQSVWPLLVEYRPMDYENEVEIQMNNEHTTSLYKLKARGVTTDEEEVTDMPLKERVSADYLYIIYPNRLSFECCVKEQRIQLVNVHNHDQNCMEFRWQNYIISDFLAITFKPTMFRLKAHHSKLCEIHVHSFERLIHFRRIPIVLEVHRIQDRATQIAKAELEEIESIDDPKWLQDSYVEHVFLQLNLRVRQLGHEQRQQSSFEKTTDASCVPCGGTLDTQSTGDALSLTAQNEQPPPRLSAREELIRHLTAKRKLNANEIIDLSMAIDQRTTIFEKLFWKYLSKSNFMRISPERTRVKFTKTYEQLISSDSTATPASGKDNAISQVDQHNTFLSILNRLMIEALSDLAKNWSFIPPEYYDRGS